MGEAAGDSAQAKHWKIYPAAPEEFLRATHELPLLMQVLYNRGLDLRGRGAGLLGGG